MIRSLYIILSFTILISCQPKETLQVNEDILTSLGSKYRNENAMAAQELRTQIEEDSTDVQALLGLAETNILQYIFGFTSREETIPEAEWALESAKQFDSLSSTVHALSGKLSMLNWDWQQIAPSFQKALVADPSNLDARHWYSLYLSATNRFEEAMLHSDTIMTLDPSGDYLIGRGSLLYFQHRFEELKHLMFETIAGDTLVPWGYDWLGMAYNGLDEHEDALSTYFKAFELSDGTVEVGGGLGHALGEAGEYDLAKYMADYYLKAAQSHYLPPVQRAFIHIGIEEHDMAIQLLEQAYEENSWFLIFVQIEPWYDPLRGDQRFQDIIDRMGFPE